MIVEGSDRLGKTTAAKRLAKFLGWEYVHYSRPSSDFNWNADWFWRLKKNTVFDRFHLGGLIYGHQLNLHPVGDNYIETCAELNATIRRLGGEVLVFHEENKDKMCEHIKTTWTFDEMYDPEQIIEANEFFGLAAKSMNLRRVQRFPDVT